ncbi:DUF5085 family protein, partial [Streptococcus pneumoniae]
NALDTVNEFFMDKDIYPTGPIIFQRELAGLGEYKYSAYIALPKFVNATYLRKNVKLFFIFCISRY